MRLISYSDMRTSYTTVGSPRSVIRAAVAGVMGGAGVMLLMACTWSRNGTGAVTRPTGVGEAATHEPAIERLDGQRFAAITITPVGSFRPGEPLVVNIGIRANIETRNARLRAWLPHLTEDMQTTARPGALSAPGKRLFDGPVSIGAAATSTISLPITFPSAGYYLINILLQASDSLSIHENRFVNNSIQQTAWLWIARQGGRMTAEFEPGLIPAGARVQPGVLQPQP